MKGFFSVIELISKPARLKSLLSFNHKGYLSQIGWYKAYESKASVDENGNPIPWVTYSFLDFIKGRLKKEHSIFEFGSGNSTWFYAKNVAKVTSVEHDKAWYEKIVASKPQNSEMIFCELEDGGQYCKMPVSLDQKFDMIIVDGRDRVNCCKQAVNALTVGGVVILDDSYRAQYREGIDFLKSNGFKELPFSGISPGFFHRSSTSVFYKAENCLGI
ncbi:MAG TPA: FkbM family methyltransferase [Pelobium sp.]|nr:FkbM family methyltransferase [Pelobium sp.]